MDKMDVDEAADNIVLTPSPAKLHLIQDEDLPTCMLHNLICFIYSYRNQIDASIEAPPSFLPQKHYCDITGLEVIYVYIVQFSFFLLH